MFYAISKHDNPLIVLGMPAMTDKQIKIDVAERTWRFGIVAEAFKILPPQEFADTIAEESLVYDLLVSDIDVNKGQHAYALKTDASRAEPNINTAPKLPDKWKEYEDVFSTEEADCLPSHKGRDYAIKTTAKPPFGPLYNLSNIELAELRRHSMTPWQRDGFSIPRALLEPLSSLFPRRTEAFVCALTTKG